MQPFFSYLLSALVVGFSFLLVVSDPPPVQHDLQCMTAEEIVEVAQVKPEPKQPAPPGPGKVLPKPQPQPQPQPPQPKAPQQGPGNPQFPKLPQKFEPKQPTGKPVELPSDRLPRFKNPIKEPPHHKPPDKRGGSWHWHPYHSWIWFPLAQAPRTIILPPNYVLPQRVYTYEQQATYVVCPHCGRTILLEQ